MVNEYLCIAAFAATAKTFIAVLFAIFSLLPNHTADAFNPPEDACISPIDCTLRLILDGFHKWDAIHFHFIALHGYLYENLLAFFPLFPIVLRFFSNLSHSFFPWWSFWTHTVLIGVFMNFVFNIICTIQLYRLSKLLLRSSSLAFASAILFVVNPASVFFSTVYSESLYSLLFFSALIYIYQGNHVSACLLLSLAVFCRSNGLTNCGYVCFPHFILLVNHLMSLYRGRRNGPQSFSLLFIYNTLVEVVYRFVILFAIVLCVSFPYLLYQYYAGFLYCSAFPKSTSLGFILPNKPNIELEKIASELGVRTPYTVNSSLPVWCAGVPWSSYTLLQKNFWNVGAFNYYQWKQLPNFLLALPALFLVVKTVFLFGRNAPKSMVSLGLFGEHIKQQLLVPHIYHVVALSLYGIVNVHIQVLTRLLFSSCPVIYWYCASVLLNEQNRIFGRPRRSKSKLNLTHWLASPFHLVNPLNYPPWSFQRALLYYCYSYIVVGCFMHSNFLPWT